jgi:hypothetical protein
MKNLHKLIYITINTVYPRSLFAKSIRGVHPRDTSFKVFVESQKCNPDPEKQQRTSTLSLLHEGLSLFRENVSLQLEQKGYITQHPGQNPITASRAISLMIK